MQILYTTSKYPTSWLIRKVTKEDCSHVAMYFEDTQEVVHCNFLGVRKEGLEDFIKQNTILHTTPIEGQLKANDLYEQYKHVKYDFAAFFYIGVRYLLPSAPKVNLWQSTGLFLCTEFVTKIHFGSPDSLITPHQLFNKIKDSLQ